MRTNFKLFIFALFLSFATVSCKKDNTSLPKKVVTTYVGSLGYVGINPIANIANPSGTATITGSKGNYTITFSDGVPSLSGLQFDKEKSGQYATSSSSNVSGVVIEGNSFTIGYVNSQGNWAFTGTK